MKYLLLLALCSCATKYAKYDVIDKHKFELGKFEQSITPKMVGNTKETKEQCVGQLLFFNNAHKVNTQNIKKLLRRTCPRNQYLLKTTLTQTWWTTLVYSRSCLKLESTCPSAKY